MVRRQNSRSLLGCRDLAAVRRHRGDHNRLGFAVRFCYPRYPGRVLAENETPPAALLGVVAAQLQVEPALWDGYAQRLFSASSWSHNARRRSTRLDQIRLSQLRRSLMHEDGDHKTVQTRCHCSIVAGRTAVLNPVRRIVASHLANNMVAWRERSCHGLSYSTSIRAHETKGSAA